MKDQNPTPDNDHYAAAVLRKAAETLNDRKLITPLTVNGCITIIVDLAEAYEKRAKETPDAR